MDFGDRRGVGSYPTAAYDTAKIYRPDEAGAIPIGTRVMLAANTPFTGQNEIDGRTVAGYVVGCRNHPIYYYDVEWGEPPEPEGDVYSYNREHLLVDHDLKGLPGADKKKKPARGLIESRVVMTVEQGLKLALAPMLFVDPIVRKFTKPVPDDNRPPTPAPEPKITVTVKVAGKIAADPFVVGATVRVIEQEAKAKPGMVGTIAGILERPVPVNCGDATLLVDFPGLDGGHDGRGPCDKYGNRYIAGGRLPKGSKSGHFLAHKSLELVNPAPEGPRALRVGDPVYLSQMYNHLEAGNTGVIRALTDFDAALVEFKGFTGGHGGNHCHGSLIAGEMMPQGSTSGYYVPLHHLAYGAPPWDAGNDKLRREFEAPLPKEGA